MFLAFSGLGFKAEEPEGWGMCVTDPLEARFARERVLQRIPSPALIFLGLESRTTAFPPLVPTEQWQPESPFLRLPGKCTGFTPLDATLCVLLMEGYFKKPAFLTVRFCSLPCRGEEECRGD